jgi:hypothetical protein
MLDFLFSVGQTASVLLMLYGGFLVMRRGPEEKLVLRKAY